MILDWIDRHTERILRTAVFAAIAALLLMIWSFFDARPLVAVGFMTVGQGLGTLSFALFLTLVINDLVRHRVIGRPRGASSSPPAEAPDEGESSARGDP
ncbi:MAG: hypothetical protein ACOCXM_08720 [Myxococcota bacterium]